MIGMGNFPFPISVNADGSIQVGNNIRIEGTPDFQGRTLGDIGQIATTPSSDPTRDPQGLTTLENIDNGRHSVTILETSGANGRISYDRAAAQDPTRGSSSTIEYNPTFEPSTAADPTIRVPADVVLQHELAHADHYSSGQADFSPAKNPNNPHRDEEITIEEENRYRDDRGIPNRADHSTA
ncbi:M91 family zinc metallopeptidase [Candidatus Thiosymbion oneisti]|nr:M91 family zinc metallopeptidase [Candidatus Thiosymbion oneisti]